MLSVTQILKLSPKTRLGCQGALGCAAREAIALIRFSTFANTGKGTICVLVAAALLEVGGDWLVNRGIQDPRGSMQALWVLSGIVALGFYSLFLNSSKIPFETLLGFYVIFFVLASQVIPSIRDKRGPSGVAWIGIGLIAAGSFVIRSQAK